MANEQEVKIKGGLWTTKIILGIIRDLLLIVMLLVGIWGALTIVPKVSQQMDSLSNLQNQFGKQGNNQYQGSNYQGNYQQSNTQNNGQGDVLKNEGEQMRSYADAGNWDAALNELNIIKSQASQLAPQVQQLLPQLETAINNKDKNTFDSLYSQAQQAASS